MYINFIKEKFPKGLDFKQSLKLYSFFSLTLFLGYLTNNSFIIFLSLPGIVLSLILCQEEKNKFLDNKYIRKGVVLLSMFSVFYSMQYLVNPFYLPYFMNGMHGQILIGAMLLGQKESKIVANSLLFLFLYIAFLMISLAMPILTVIQIPVFLLGFYLAIRSWLIFWFFDRVNKDKI